jgi:PAP2 superfamily
VQGYHIDFLKELTMSSTGGWGGDNATNPMLVDALSKSRDALVGAYPSGNLLNPSMPNPVDEVMQLRRWDSNVRFSVCQAELFGSLNFVVQGSSGSFRHLDATGVLDQFSAKNIVTLTRPDQPLFVKQLDLVMNWASLRDDRASEILTQVVPQVPFWGSIVNLQPHRHKYTVEVIGLALSLAWQVEMRFKHAFACPRPVEYSPQVQPMITTPGHGSLPSGHSTEAFTVARVLQSLLGAAQGSETDHQLQRQAARIAINRTVAGLHFPVDSAAGRLLGEALAGYFVGRCSRTGNNVPVQYTERTFNGANFNDNGNALDFDYHAPLQGVNPNPFNIEGPVHTLHVNSTSPILEKLWELAKEEWA